MHDLLLVLVLLAAVFGPSLWVKHVMRRYSEPACRARGLRKVPGCETALAKPTERRIAVAEERGRSGQGIARVDHADSAGQYFEEGH